MAKPKKKRNPVVLEKSQLPESVKKSIPKYKRVRTKATLKHVKDKKLKGMLTKHHYQAESAATRAARAEALLSEEPGFLEAEGMEKTCRIKQKDISQAVDVTSASKIFDLKLDKFGPYSINYTRNGRFILLGGRRGHLATFDWTNKKLGCEFHVQETVRDVQYLHNELMFATAQKKHVYIYDNTGMELHCLKDHYKPTHLQFLPYHFLLVSAGDWGRLRYHDISTGQLVATRLTKLGASHCLTHNPRNAIIHMGHHNGTVTMWCPSMASAVVKMLCHKRPVTAVAIDHGGWYMATSGMDSQLKIWDIRTYKPLHAYYTPKPAACMDISQRGLLAVAYNRNVQVWKDAFGSKQSMPYMEHTLLGAANSLQFCPYEDVLGIGHAYGFSSIVVPGAGEPNFDALEANPYQTKRQRQEGEVKQLLDKIPADLISLDPDEIVKVDRISKEVLDSEKGTEAMVSGGHKKKHRTRGKSSIQKHLSRKQSVKDTNLRDMIRTTNMELQDQAMEKTVSKPQSVLDRFRTKQ